MLFPVSGVECPWWLPPLVAFLVSSLTATAGVSGAFLLLPFQMSVLHFTSPAVSPTNLIYNIIAIPGGLYRYIKEGRMAWPLTWAVILGTLPGVFAGAIIRIRFLPDPRHFKLFVAMVLLYLGGRLLYELTGRSKGQKEQRAALEKKFQELVNRAKAEGKRRAAGLGEDAVIRTRSVSLSKIEYEFWGENFSFSPAVIFLLALTVGLVGGIYGIGGGAIIAPFVVAVLGLPVYTVAGAALAGTFITSIGGVLFFEILARAGLGQDLSLRPDWLLGAMFGIGGLAGTYAGARLQKFLPETIIRALLAGLIIFLAAKYVLDFFTT
jgi:uncharacterized membrane protein YfcA